MEPILSRNFRPGGEPLSLAEYEKAGGYSALRKAITQHTPDEIVQMVVDADVKGRGGAGYPAGKKWSGLPPIEKSWRPRIVATNFDEMEPGTYKDRWLVEGDPHQLIEGTLIQAYACRAELGYIFVRAEYVESARVLKRALAEARQAGYIGKRILGADFDFELWLHISAGRYMCGEAAGLMNAIEGKPAIARTSPPHKVVAGAWSRPTVVNNVETICCVPHIVQQGAEWFKGLGRGRDAGTKVYSISGRVKRPGCYELPIGTTLRELVEEHAGGMLDGYKFVAALPGGASTKFMGTGDMEVPLDFESLKEIKHYLGTGAVIVLDDHTCPVGMVHNLQQFFARESCGWCTPCRDGLPWVEGILGSFERGQARMGDIELLGQLSDRIRDKSFCELAQGATFSIDSSLERFHDVYEEHVRRGACPWRVSG